MSCITVLMCNALQVPRRPQNGSTKRNTSGACRRASSGDPYEGFPESFPGLNTRLPLLMRVMKGTKVTNVTRGTKEMARLDEA